MDVAAAIQSLETEWDQVEANGFFGKLGFGEFDIEGFKRVQVTLDSVHISDGEIFDKRFIEVTWFIPTYMRWQQDAWHMDGKDTRQLDEAISFFEQRLTTILGLP